METKLGRWTRTFMMVLQSSVVCGYSTFIDFLFSHLTELWIQTPFKIVILMFLVVSTVWKLCFHSYSLWLLLLLCFEFSTTINSTNHLTGNSIISLNSNHLLPYLWLSFCFSHYHLIPWVWLLCQKGSLMVLETSLICLSSYLFHLFIHTFILFSQIHQCSIPSLWHIQWHDSSQTSFLFTMWNEESFYKSIKWVWSQFIGWYSFYNLF